MIFKQIIKFGIVGVIATVIDYVVLYMLTECFNIYYLVSAIISFSISLIINYCLSVKWVFDVKKRQTIKEVFIFVFLSVLGLIINEIILYAGVNLLNVYYMICKLFSTIVVMIYNFITRKIFIEK